MFSPFDLETVLLKYFWGWTPESWAALTFTNEARRETIIRESSDPFAVAICVSQSAPDRSVAGYVAGCYWVSHVKGHRDEFTAPFQHSREPNRWQYALKAVRAFSFLPEYRPTISQQFPQIADRVRAVGTYGEWLDADEISQLRQIPFVEVPLFGGSTISTSVIHVPSSEHGQGVRAGPVNRSGYQVLGEPVDTEKELYVLEMIGDMSAVLEQHEESLRVFKVGLSISPSTRLESFQKALPKGRLGWSLARSTRRDGHKPYTSFEAAEIGERAMKQYLGNLRKGAWLGGEFYAATEAEMETAWSLGRKAATNYEPSVY